LPEVSSKYEHFGFLLSASHVRLPPNREGLIMTVARISEISSVSKKSFEDAILQGVARANKTLKNVKGAWVKDQEVMIEKGKVTGFKVILKVTFVLND
jgi:dodecin